MSKSLGLFAVLWFTSWPPIGIATAQEPPPAALQEILQLREALGAVQLPANTPQSSADDDGDRTAEAESDFAAALQQAARSAMLDDSTPVPAAAAENIEPWPGAEDVRVSQPARTDADPAQIPLPPGTEPPSHNVVQWQDQLRTAAWHLDQVAHTWELCDRYQEADELRQLAQRLREEARYRNTPASLGPPPKPTAAAPLPQHDSPLPSRSLPGVPTRGLDRGTGDFQPHDASDTRTAQP